MPIEYGARQEHQLKDLDRESPIHDFPVRHATFNWPPTMYVVVSQLVTLAAREIGSTTRSEIVASAAARLGPIALTGDDLDNRLRRYRKTSLEDVMRDPVSTDALEKFPRHSGVTLPEPMHILLKEMQWASLSKPNQSDIAGLAVFELARGGDAEAGEAVMDYRQARVGDLFPGSKA
jgi:hypothetical protein